ncbi:MAG: hypothetical protein DRP73_02660, partial [Candidatus Omnitrophota bacterium]
MKKIMIIVPALCTFVNFSYHNRIHRRVKDIEMSASRNFQPLIAVLQDYWGDDFNTHINFLLDVYAVWVEKNSEMVKTKLIELRQFHPLLFIWILGIRASVLNMEFDEAEEIIKGQLWQAVPQPARKNLKKLLHKETRTKNEQKFLNWLNQNNYTLKEAVYRFISGIY